MSVVDNFEAENPDLPRLSGSDKQVGWARQIRARAYPHMDAAIEFAIGVDFDLDTRVRFVRIALACLECADAAWWIDRRRHLESRGTFHDYVNARAGNEICQERQEAQARAGRGVSCVA